LSHTNKLPFPSLLFARCLKLSQPFFPPPSFFSQIVGWTFGESSSPRQGASRKRAFLLAFCSAFEIPSAFSPFLSSPGRGFRFVAWTGVSASLFFDVRVWFTSLHAGADPLFLSYLFVGVALRQSVFFLKLESVPRIPLTTHFLPPPPSGNEHSLRRKFPRRSSAQGTPFFSSSLMVPWRNHYWGSFSPLFQTASPKIPRHPFLKTKLLSHPQISPAWLRMLGILSFARVRPIVLSFFARLKYALNLFLFLLGMHPLIFLGLKMDLSA